MPVARWLVLEGVSASRSAFRPFLTASIWVHTIDLAGDEVVVLRVGPLA